jgi:hypothetical protein
MSFLSSLFGKKPEPTVEVALPPTSVDLVWDTSTATLNGIALGAPASAFAPLGPCPDISYISDTTTYYCYPHLGVLLEVTSGELEFITLIISEDEYNPLGETSAFANLTIQPAGVTLDSDLDAETLTNLLGAFTLTDKDEEEVVGIFRMGNVCHEATFAPGARLVSLVISVDE